MTDYSSFVVHPDFEMELVAMEPLIFDPIDLKFDEKGNAYVMEMPSYPTGEEQNRIVLIKDKDKDGIYDERVVFAENLGVATSVLPYKGGLLVAAPPDLLFLKDNDGDDKADQRDILMSGYSYGNTQHNFNALTYGLDNWIYGVEGGNSGKPYWIGDENNPIDLQGNDFRFKIETKIFQRIGNSSGGFGLAMDDYGNLFETHNLEHISQLVFNEKYLHKIPELGKNALFNISDHEEGGLSRIYPIGKQDSRVNHPEQSGYFSGSCGITHYGGGAFSEEFNGNIFVADVVLNLVHRDKLRQNGTVSSASRGREKVEFLASTDRSFRPVNMTTGPDGALYIIDMYRDVIEHPEWIPDEIEKTLDIHAGKDKGRIYKIIPKSTGESFKINLDFSTKEKQLEYLSHPNQWFRITAQRLLVESGDASLQKPLEKLVQNSDNHLGRLHGAYTLQGLNLLTDEMVLRLIKDNEYTIRIHGLKLAEGRWDNPAFMQEILIGFPNEEKAVQLQTLLSLSTNKTITKEEVIQISQQIPFDIVDPWMELAFLSVVGDNPFSILEYLINKEKLSNHYSLIQNLSRLVTSRMIEKQGVEELIALIALSAISDEIKLSILDGILLELHEENNIFNTTYLKENLNKIEEEDNLDLILRSWKLREKLNIVGAGNEHHIIEIAKKRIADEKVDENGKIQSLQIIGFSRDKNVVDELSGFIHPSYSEKIQMKAIELLLTKNKEGIAEIIIDKWNKMVPEVKRYSSDILIYNKLNHRSLLVAIEEGIILLGELNLHLERRRYLLNTEDEVVRQKAEKLFSDEGVYTRKEVLEDYQIALKLQGDSDEGKKVFINNCSQCHIKGKEGVEVGPNLTEIARKSGGLLLHDILDPNAAVNNQFISYMIKMKSGEVLNGIIVNQNENSITVKSRNGITETIMRSEITVFTSSGLSLMPEGIEASINHQQMADLLEYLQIVE
ncbi:MAG: c-type cytochrome [Cyclobacteriaceae bacterium]|nr:c-type cytochrome [Cyclobacteriaceae bacterium]